MNKCFIIGGGPSLAGFNFAKLANRDIIAVNQAIFRCSTAKYFVTMDYTWNTKNNIYPGSKSNKYQIFKESNAYKVFVLGLSEPRLRKVDEHHFIDTKFNLPYDLSLYNKIVRVGGYGGIGLTYEDFRCGSDSGYSAIQLAVVLGYKVIYLLGFDFTVSNDQTHWHTDYGIKRKRVAEFDSKLKEYIRPYSCMINEIKEKTDIKLYSCSKISMLNSFIPFVKVEEALAV